MFNHISIIKVILMLHQRRLLVLDFNKVIIIVKLKLSIFIRDSELWALVLDEGKPSLAVLFIELFFSSFVKICHELADFADRMFLDSALHDEESSTYLHSHGATWRDFSFAPI